MADISIDTTSKPGRKPFYGTTVKQTTVHMPESLIEAIKDEVLVRNVRERDHTAWTFSRVVNQVLIDFFDLELPTND